MEKKELKEAFALWENKKGDLTYYTGKTTTEEGTKEFPIRLVAFLNSVKKNPNSPDVTIYISGDKDSKEPKKEFARAFKATAALS